MKQSLNVAFLSKVKTKMFADQVLSVKVGSLMTQKVVSIDASMTADEVAKLIVEHKIESFPVTEKGKLVGIVTGWDLLTKVVARALNPSKVKAEEFMTRSPITCSPDQSVLQVTKLMAKHEIKHIPVVKNRQVVGIFTTYDVTIFRQLVQPADFRSSARVLGNEVVLEPVPRETGVSTVVVPDRISTGYGSLDNLLLGGIPENCAVILTSPPCNERDLLIEKFLETGAKSGEVTFYVTTNPGEIKTLAEEFQSHFYLFVCNPQANSITESFLNVFKLRGVENLTDINVALSSAFGTLDISVKGPRRICIEVVSDVLLQHHAVHTRRWLNALIPQLRSKGFTTLAVIDPWMHTSQEVRAILDLFEGEINIHRKGSKAFLEIKRMPSQKFAKSGLPLREEKQIPHS